MGLAVSCDDDRKEEKVGVIQGVLIHINAIITIQNPISRINSSDRSSLTYLIIVSYACYGVGVLFSSRRSFFQEERIRDCFKQSLFREKNADSHFHHIHHTKHQMCHSNKEIRQPKHQIRRLISKDNATKPPRTPSISKRICQPKHQVHHLPLIKCLLQLK